METLIVIAVYGVTIIMFGFNSWLSMLNYKNRFAEIPEEVKDIYDEEKYQTWLKYNMETFRFSSVYKVVDLVLFLVLLITGAFVWVKDISLVSSSTSIQLLIFMGIYYSISFIFGIASSYYFSFHIEEKFGFNKMTIKTFIFDKIKSLILTIVFGGGIVYLLFTLYTNVGNMFFVYSWVALIVIMLGMNMVYTSLIVPIFNKLTPLPEGPLKEKIVSMAAKTDYAIDRISVMDSSKRSTKLNAYFSGLGKTKKIVLYDTLVDKMSDDEIVAVLAHEIGHNKKHHTVYSIIQMMITLSLYIGIFLVVLNDTVSTAFGFDQLHFGFSIIMFGVLIEPIVTFIGVFTSKLSRKFEYQADAFAADNASKEFMISALKVLSRENFANLTPHPLFVKMRYSHPPTADRIKAINKLK